MAGVLRREKLPARPAFSFQDLETKARALLDQANAEAREILARAEREARERGARLEQEARQRGLEEGRKLGFQQARDEATQTARQEARADLAQLGRALADGLAALEQDKRMLLASAESGMIELALAIARRVCKHDVGRSSDAARANVRALLEMVEHGSDLRLHLNPAECDLLKVALPEFRAAVGQLAHAEIVPDAAVARGGCILRCQDGEIDATQETQLERIAAALARSPDQPD